MLKRLVIDLNARQLTFYDKNGLANRYPIAIGKPSSPTPLGNYQVINKLLYPGGGLGTRWMELNIPSDGGPYGIHGTNNPSSIGQAVSNGCIRMFNQDIESIFPHIPLYTPVKIVANMWQNNPANSPYLLVNVYIVQSRDTLYQIALYHGLTPDALLLANPTINPNRIYPGQQLVIPK